MCVPVHSDHEIDRESIQVLLEGNGWFEPTVLVREYRVRLQRIPDVALRIRTYFDPDRDREPYRFALSHYAATPAQAGPYVPSAPWRPTESSALRAGIKAVVDYVESAAREGHVPDERWLRPSSAWD